MLGSRFILGFMGQPSPSAYSKGREQVDVGRRNPPKKKKAGKTVTLKVTLKSLTTEKSKTKEPELIIFKTHPFKL